jgi:leader peptidase (prepilin peptidase)/N-methyltransferase
MNPDLINALPLVAAPLVGSFLAAVAYRLPRGLGFVAGRSRCDGCGTVLGGLELVPIVGWLWRRGRCGHCGGAIAVDNLVLELAALVLAVWAWTVLDGWLLWAGCGFAWCLALAAAIDARHQVLPDGLTLPLLLAGLAVAAALDSTMLADHALGAVAGYGAFALIAWLYRRIRGQEGLGLGDAKLLAAIGAWVGWPGLPSTVLYGALAAIVASIAFRKAGLVQAAQPIPFGPFLAIGGWLVWLYGPLEITF